jgi:hypothetical protein
MPTLLMFLLLSQAEDHARLIPDAIVRVAEAQARVNDDRLSR